MAKKVKKTKTVDKWRKKRYFTVFAPKIFQERELGQSMAYGPDELMGRRVSTNLMVLTGNVRKQNINITFRVDKVKGDTAYTIVERYSIAPAAIKRKVRRQRDRLDDSAEYVTKDKKVIRIKPIIMTANKVSRAVRTALRAYANKYITEHVGSVDYDTFVNDIVIEKFQRELKNKLSKTSPVRSVDIRIMRFVSDAKELKKEAEETSEKPE